MTNKIASGVLPAGNFGMVLPGTGDILKELHASSATQKYPLGQIAMHADGRLFRYGQAAAAIAAGNVCGNDTSAIDIANADAVDAAVAAGEVVFRLDHGNYASISENQLSGSYALITDADGQGQFFRIRENIATENTDEITITLEDNTGLDQALTTSSGIAIIGSKGQELVPATAATDMNVVGGAMAALADNEYGWFVFQGLGPALIDGTIAQGDPLTLSDGVAGAVQILGGGGAGVGDLVTEMLIGSLRFNGVDTEFGVVDYCLAP